MVNWKDVYLYQGLDINPNDVRLRWTGEIIGKIYSIDTILSMLNIPKTALVDVLIAKLGYEAYNIDAMLILKAIITGLGGGGPRESLEKKMLKRKGPRLIQYIEYETREYPLTGDIGVRVGIGRVLYGDIGIRKEMHVNIEGDLGKVRYESRLPISGDLGILHQKLSSIESDIGINYETKLEITSDIGIPMQMTIEVTGRLMTMKDLMDMISSI